jgi:hypothetical protein
MDRRIRKYICGTVWSAIGCILASLVLFFLGFLIDWSVRNAYENNNCLVLKHELDVLPGCNLNCYSVVTTLLAQDEPWVGVNGTSYGIRYVERHEADFFMSSNPVGSLRKCLVNTCELTDRHCMEWQVNMAVLVLYWWSEDMWLWLAVSIGLFLVGLYFVGAAVYLCLPSPAWLIPYLSRLYCCCPRRPLAGDHYDELL